MVNYIFHQCFTLFELHIPMLAVFRFSAKLSRYYALLWGYGDDGCAATSRIKLGRRFPDRSRISAARIGSRYYVIQIGGNA